MNETSSHSLLSPSSSHRWMRCGPSARLTENYPDTGSQYARDGTAGHSVAEAKLKYRLGLSGAPPKCEDTETDEYTTEYVNFVFEQMADLTDPQMFVEQKVDCTDWVPDCRGTVDALIISDGALHVIDLKTGRGVPVFAERNEQLMLYALGAIGLLGCLYEISMVRLSIFQPKLNSATTWEISREELETWGETVLKSAAQTAWNGEGEYCVGDHCRFCKAKSECRARAEMAFEAAREDFKRPPLLEDDEIESILERLDDIESWAKDIREYAYNAALNGKRWKDWKLVAGRSNRVISDEPKAADILESNGYTDIWKRELLGITALEKKIGKTQFNTLLSEVITKPTGKPTLVRRSDKRQEITVTSAAQDFEEPVTDPEYEGD